MKYTFFFVFATNHKDLVIMACIYAEPAQNCAFFSLPRGFQHSSSKAQQRTGMKPGKGMSHGLK